MTLPAQYRPLTVGSGIHLAATRTPDKIAVREGARELSYAALSARIAALARRLVQLGIAKGERIAVLAPNCLEYPELVCGIADAGLIAVTLNPRSHPRELTAVLDDAAPRGLLVHPSLEPLLAGVPATTFEWQVRLGPDYEHWRDVADAATPLPTITEFDPFVLVYTSGTTGRAKGLLLPHRARGLLFMAKAIEYGCYGTDDRFLGVAPMALGAGFGFGTCSLFHGGFLEILPAFDPEAFLHKLSVDRFTGVFVVPSHLQAIFALPPAVLDRYRAAWGGLKTIISNAAALPYALKQQTVEYFGEGRLHETYGFTEAGIVTNLRPAEQLSRPGSVGRAFPLVDVRVLDDAGRPVARGDVGELFVSSPYLFNGYWRQPEETAAATRDRWISAGDLAREDEDGCYYLVDRKKDMVVSGGMNVYPREIEEVLFRHPAVADVAVIGLPDERWGERLRGYVVLRPGLSASGPELEAHCRSELAAYKAPRDFVFVDALPRNTSGKVLKRVLRDQART